MKLATRAALAAASTVAVLAGISATAPAASAASLPKGCYGGSPHTKDVSIAVNLRSGPGTNYTSLGILYSGADFTEYCVTKDYTWSYGKVTSGPNKNKWGWVSYNYLNPVYN